MREVELKGVAGDPDAVREALRAVGARLVFRGSMVDRRYDTPEWHLRQRDEVLRIRVTRDAAGTVSALEFKGAASHPGGFKVRDEVTSTVGDLAVVERILGALGLHVTREIEREVEVFEVHGAVVRFEVYPRMDVLLEVEGEPDAIERAIAATGVPREAFTCERLADFARRYEARTGLRAALCAIELEGDDRYRLDDA